jgi:DNA-binding transcriptional MerR regulator
VPTQYAIKDLERLSGIKAHTLRIWELRYGILKPERSCTNIRCYTPDDLKRILNIPLLNNNGYKISKIATFMDDELVKHAQIILNKFAKESDQIDNLVLCMMEMDEQKFDATVSNCITHFGFENTMERIIFPFMRHVGSMWQVGVVNCAQEHFISQLIKQKIIVAIDRLPFETGAGHKTYALYLPNKELHDMGLLYAKYLIRAKGHKCLYLGQSVPLCDLKDMVDTMKADVLVTVFTTPMEDFSLEQYLDKLSSAFNDCSIMVSGRLFYESAEEMTLPKNVILFESHEQFKNLL